MEHAHGANLKEAKELPGNDFHHPPEPNNTIQGSPVIALPLANPSTATIVTAPHNIIRLERAGDGHFYTDAMVNGAPIRFLVDTGASSIARSPEDAQRAGLAFGSGDFTGSAQTAGGLVATKPVMLDRVAIGPLEATQVEGAIVQSGLGISLLGQSWLRRVGTVTINGDVMELR